MSKVKKPTSITTIKECEEALEWIDLELDKLDPQHTHHKQGDFLAEEVDHHH